MITQIHELVAELIGDVESLSLELEVGLLVHDGLAEQHTALTRDELHVQRLGGGVEDGGGVVVAAERPDHRRLLGVAIVDLDEVKRTTARTGQMSSRHGCQTQETTEHQESSSSS